LPAGLNRFEHVGHWFDVSFIEMCLERLDVFDVEVAVTVAGREVVPEVDLDDEPLVAAELLSQ
jgi:hypothetical protein